MASIGTTAPRDPAVAALRRFDRYATRMAGALARHYLDSPFTLQEARALYEIANTDRPNATLLRERLGLDNGYLSRILGRLEAQRLITRETDANDGRSRTLALTAKGRKTFRDIGERADRHAVGRMEGLSTQERARLTEAMVTVERILGRGPEAPAPVLIRDARPGDLGWTFHRQIGLYKAEYRWTDLFEHYVAEGLAPYLAGYDPRLDRLWIAESAGVPVGSVAIQHDPEQPGSAKLRWFFVEKTARGRGVGTALLDTALDFARRAGHRSINLWTVDELGSARRAYERVGFRLLQETECPWAPWAKQQEWGLELRPADRPTRHGVPNGTHGRPPNA